MSDTIDNLKIKEKIGVVIFKKKIDSETGEETLEKTIINNNGVKVTNTTDITITEC